MSKCGIALLSHFNKIDRMHYSTFDVGRPLVIVGWVEPTPGIVGFRCTQPKLHFFGVIMKCEIQQRPISEPIHNSFFSDQNGRKRP